MKLFKRKTKPINKKKNKKPFSQTNEIEWERTNSISYSTPFDWGYDKQQYWNYNDFGERIDLLQQRHLDKEYITTNNNNLITNIDMNDTVNQNPQENAIKYLTEKRTEASPVIELDIKDYNKLKEENAELKANKDIICYNEAYDGDVTISYAGKDKAILDLTNINEKKENEIRQLIRDIKLEKEKSKESTSDYCRKAIKYKTAIKEKYADQFDKKNKELINEHKEEVKDLNDKIDQANDIIIQSNDRNKILADLNNKYKNTLLIICNLLTKKRLHKLFRRIFGLDMLLEADNLYRLRTIQKDTWGNHMRDTYINNLTGNVYYS